MDNNQNLFNFSGTATARNSDPATSHLAADRMNEGGRLTRHQIIVLGLISRHSGLTAKQLGVILAKEQNYPPAYEWPRKRMKELVSKNFVIRRADFGCSELNCHITETGKNYLERLK